MNKPTKKQAALLKFIDEFTIKNNQSPSYREIQSALGLSSVATVAQHIDNCVAAGYLKKNPNEARSLVVLSIEEHKETTNLFKHKISELEEKLSATEDASDIDVIKDDLMTLKAAAKLLNIDL